LTVRLHRLAEAEIREAAEWYESRGEGLGTRYLAAVRKALEELETEPHRFAKLETIAKRTSIARVLVKGFPYLVVFEVFGEETFVYAVCQASRRPNYWRGRKREPS
jgi:hypothetical protein